MGRVLALAPLDLVDLLFDLEGLQVVEFWLVGLKLGVELVFARFFLVLLAGAHQHGREARLTVSFLSKSTTLPPLSPVAR